MTTIAPVVRFRRRRQVMIKVCQQLEPPRGNQSHALFNRQRSLLVVGTDDLSVAGMVLYREFIRRGG